MNLLHDAYTALLAGLTHRTGNEIHWVGRLGDPITVEPVDVSAGSYIVRCYNEYGSLWEETDYFQNQRHGRFIWYHPNGQKRWEKYYHQNLLHGKCVGWYPNGQIRWEKHYHHGQLHGQDIEWHNNGYKIFEGGWENDKQHGKYQGWYPNGQLNCKYGYHQGEPHGKFTWWREDGTLRSEQYFINGRKVTRREWEQYNDTTT